MINIYINLLLEYVIILFEIPLKSTHLQ